MFMICSHTPTVNLLLQHHGERLHDCKARAIGSEPVSETFGGKTVWEGVVHVFALEGHRTADKAYAWSSPIEGSTKRRYFAVLRQAPIKSAQDAVRAAIVAEHRAG